MTRPRTARARGRRCAAFSAGGGAAASALEKSACRARSDHTHEGKARPDKTAAALAAVLLMASAQRVLARQDGPTVLVGHSFSGMIVTEAGIDPNVSALVYVAARAPDAGEDYAALAKTFPTPPASAGIVFDGDEGRLTEAAFLRDFAGDLPEAKAKVLYAVQEPFQKALLAGKTTQAAWRSKPSFYAVSTEDRTINPDLERFMAKRMGAKTIEVKASHLSLISHPEEITRLILEAAGQQT
jgi:pimeloyl-ACP methyl ester carboxylesterase